MRKTPAPKLLIAMILLLYGLVTEASISKCSPIKGQLTSVEGLVEIGYGGKDWQPGKMDSPLCEDDSIRVGANSRAAISLIGDVVLRLDQNTTVRLIDLTDKQEERSVIEVLIGALQSLSRSPRKLAINTPYINGMIEGTEFLTRVEPGRADITVFEGKVIAQNDKGSLPLTHGQSAEAKQGQAPQPRVIVRPRDAVQWALYYPPVLDLRPNQFPDTLEWQGLARHSIEAYQAGNIPQAFDLLDKVPGSVTDPDFLAYRAALFLNVGRVDRANDDIIRIMREKPNDGNALALQTIIKVVQNQEGQALDIAQKAVLAVPDSPGVLMALSYAQQSVFDLEGARKTIEKILRRHPDNALAWARLSELQASFGELDDALKAAEKSATLKPNLSRTQTVQGFSQLMQINTQKARESFNKAIATASSDPLPRLGLGLTKIREGHLAEGRRDLEIAAGMDPNNAIVRSYLGKAYYEEKRTALTDREYETAKELDQNDPTPFFYDAIQKQTTNRPVEALHSIQKAIELNDNRAVYRSSLLIDGDLAARSTSLARVYTDMGFQQRALVEGWKSVNIDPSNFSAHRFLADSYSALPRHEIARVSELLQSQLLQPLNMTPIQPHLAESNLFLISAGGPGSLSFNEFNPIFNRNGLTFQTSGMVGENNTYAGEGVLSGIYQNTAFSIGGYHYTTDGFRTNADQKDDIANAFLQMELSPDTSLQAEYRYRNSEIGDLQLRFFPDEFFPGQRSPLETNTFRLGGRHAFSPNSIVLGSFIYSDATFGAFDTQPFVDPGFITFLGIDEPQEAFNGEVQHLYRTQNFTLTSGVGHFDRNSRANISARTVLPPPNDLIPFPQLDTDLKHTNIYSYSNFRAINNLTITLGLSGEFSDSNSQTEEGGNELNPKFGMMWNPLRNTLVRFAAFRTTKRPIITNQTLEPTQVAGFNQFFDDFNGTRAWRYGSAIDQIFSQNLYGGIELSRRDQLVPAFDQFGTATRADWQEDLARTYLFWTPNPWVALKTEYQFEKIKREELLTDGVKESDTHKIPLGINFFHPSGLSSSVKATYFNQEGIFESIKTGALQKGQDSFWTVDAAINYRLPKRYGFLSVGATNLLDEEFKYFDTDYKNPSIRPDRMIYGSVTLALP